MYIGKHIGCNVKALNKTALCKYSHDTWLFSNNVKLADFEKVCVEPGSQIVLNGIDWGGDTIPSWKIIFRDDNGELVVYE